MPQASVIIADDHQLVRTWKKQFIASHPDLRVDAECRTASRRMRARIASGDPALFRRKARADTAAAAVVWIAGKANGLFTARYSGIHIQVSELSDHFGLKGSVSQRAATILRAGGFSDDTYRVFLGSPDFLIADRRQWIMGERDRLQGAAN